jgi:hypothetical protein
MDLFHKKKEIATKAIKLQEFFRMKKPNVNHGYNIEEAKIG